MEIKSASASTQAPSAPLKVRTGLCAGKPMSINATSPGGGKHSR